MNRRVTLLAISACAIFPALATWAGDVSLGAPSVANNQVTFPVSIGGDMGTGVSALDFRFHYDPAVFRPVSVDAGSAAVDADKRIEWNVRTPGECVVVMMGMNQTLCQAGEVAQVVLQRLGEAAAGDYSFSIARPTLASAEGDVIDAKGTEGTYSFEAPPKNDNPDSANKPSGDEASNPGAGTRPGDSGVRPSTPPPDGQGVAGGNSSAGLGRGGNEPGGAVSNPRANGAGQGARPADINQQLAAIDKLRAALPGRGEAPVGKGVPGASSSTADRGIHSSPSAAPGGGIEPLAAKREELAAASAAAGSIAERNGVVRQDAATPKGAVSMPPRGRNGSSLVLAAVSAAALIFALFLLKKMLA